MFDFPYDTQKCSLDFGNVLEPAETVNIVTPKEPVDLSSFYPSNEFDVHAAGVDRYTQKVIQSNYFFMLTHLQLVPHICISELSRHWSR